MLFTPLSVDVGTAARTGDLALPHGSVRTPVFMPVGTAASVKSLSPSQLYAINTDIILANTYHLYLRPGTEVIQTAGGLHSFMNWKRNILTDSGGFQIFSLRRLQKLSDEGLAFSSHIDGSAHFLTPERVVEVQNIIGSDIQMVLDVCTGAGTSKAQAAEALHITAHWAARAIQRWKALGTGSQEARRQLFGIVQGNFFEDLRKESAERTIALGFPGFAIGGLSVGEEFSQFQHVLAYTSALLPQNKPRYLMGIGTPEYILEAIEHGVDMFDCVFPTRIGRNGSLFTPQGRMSLTNARYRLDLRPVMEDGPIVEFSRSYLRHLFKAGEMLASSLASLHNLWFLRKLVEDARRAIEDGKFLAFKRAFLAEYTSGDIR